MAENDSASFGSTRPAQPGQSELDELVARCVELMEIEGEAAIDRVCAQAPALAEQVQSRLEQLRAMGLLRPKGPRAMPERIGPYQLIEQIGSGGMGVVYLAEQHEPVRRRVALKVIKAGMDSDEIVGRFETERQALALMSHPCIAKVFDAGSTDQGRPYFVMEHVPGLPITSYCDQHRLSTDQRLALFVSVCAAVHHAHQKGIIHRDLKPSNILVSDEDGQPVPKVIDFGIAKATGAAVTDDSPVTVPGRIMGTLEYMSPEQADSGGQDVDTRTDVYSLGVVLYELLCGEVPFRFTSQWLVSIRELHRVLQEVTPTAPSSRVADGDTASARGTDASTLRRRLRGDLDWIVLRALEKDRSRRYASAIALAEDVQRHLEHTPVVAGPAGWYRARKFVRRHRVAVTAASVTLVALVSGLVVSTLFYADAKASAERALAAKTKETAALGEALDYFRLARDAVERVVKVGSDTLEDVPQMSGVRRELLEEALRFYEKLLERRSDHANLRVEAAAARDGAATILRELGEYQRSIQLSEEGLSLADGLVAEAPGDPGFRYLRAALRANYANTLGDLGRKGDSIQARRDALVEFAECRRLAPPEGRSNRRSGEAATHVNLGIALEEDAPSDAVAALRAGIRMLEELRTTEPNDPESIYLLALGRSHLGHVLKRLGEFDRAEPPQRAAIELLAWGLDALGERRTLRTVLAEARERLAELLKQTGRAAEAEVVQRDAVADWRRLNDSHPGVKFFERSMAFARTVLARVLEQQGKFEWARNELQGAIDLQERILEEANGNPVYARDLSVSYINQASSLGNAVIFNRARESDLADAASAARRALELLQGLPEEHRQRVTVLSAIGGASVTLARLLQMSGDSDVAGHYRVARDAFEELVRRQPDNQQYRQNLATTLATLGQADVERPEPEFASARELLRRAIDEVEAALEINPDSPQAADQRVAFLALLAEAEVGCRDHQAAAATAERIVELSDYPDDLRRAGGVWVECAALAGSDGIAEEYRERARTVLARALEGFAAAESGVERQPAGMRAEMKQSRAEAHAALGRLLRSSGDVAKGQRHLAAALEHYRRISEAERAALPAVSAGLRGAFIGLIEAHLVDGEAGSAAAVARELAKTLPDDPHASWAAARGLARADETADGDVIDLLRRSAAIGFVAPIPPAVDPAFARLTATEGFVEAAAELAEKR